MDSDKIMAVCWESDEPMGTKVSVSVGFEVEGSTESLDYVLGGRRTYKYEASTISWFQNRMAFKTS